ncbi:MAG: amino acid-binding ACT domain protein [Candidatus Methanomethylicia archaeon]
MWNILSERFQNDPAKMRVARLVIELGLRVYGGEVYIGPLKVTLTSIAKALNVDRKTVREAVKILSTDEKLGPILSKIRSAGAFLNEASKILGYTLVIVEADSHMPGIIAGITKIIADAGRSIRQIMAEDPDLFPEPKLYIVIDGKIQEDLISEMLKVRGVKKVSIS